MQLTEVSAKTGYVWFRQGLWLFRRNPFAFLMLVILYTFVAVLIEQIPVPGIVLLPLLFVPGFAAGFMAACREVVAGRPVLPTMLFDGFAAHGPRAARRLLWLGVLYAAILILESVLLAMLLTAALKAIDPDLLRQFIKLSTGANGAAAIALPDKDFTVPGSALIVILAVLAWQVFWSCLVTLLFWFASVTSAWHDASPAKAIFFGVVSLWRNRGAFIVYGALWCAMTTVILLIVLFVMLAAGVSGIRIQMMAMMPVMLVIVTMVYCSLYATYRGCFGEQEQNSPPKAADAGVP